MSERDESGPAFSIADFYQPWSHNSSMSLRDYFAGQVVAGWGEGFHSIAYELHHQTPEASDVAEAAYVIADAMLKERTK